MSAWQLYVWDGPYDVSYGHSIVYAVARSLKEAKAAAAKGNVLSFDTLWDDTDRPDLTRYVNRRNLPLGEPTRILDLPCAEWREWSE